MSTQQDFVGLLPWYAWPGGQKKVGREEVQSGQGSTDLMRVHRMEIQFGRVSNFPQPNMPVEYAHITVLHYNLVNHQLRLL